MIYWLLRELYLIGKKNACVIFFYTCTWSGIDYLITDKLKKRKLVERHPNEITVASIRENIDLSLENDITKILLLSVCAQKKA